MSCFKTMLAVAFSTVVALGLGGAQSALAQCENGKCSLPANFANLDAPKAVAAPASGYVIDYKTVTSVVPPLVENTSNIISYSSNFVMPTTITNYVDWSMCGSSCGTYYSPVQTWSVPLHSFYPAPISYEAVPSCSGGQCNFR